MIHVLTIISYDNSLLKHFVKYYTSLGVESFIIAIDERTPTILSSTKEICATLQAEIKIVPVSERQRKTGVEENNKEEMREKYVSQDDWIIPADLDEFIQFPAEIPKLIDEMIQNQATFINGIFSDRLSHSGILTSTDQTQYIWEQYPLEAEVSSKLVKCWCTKVTLARGDCVLTSGHHNVIAPCKPLINRKCKIHHFKWRLGLKEALEKRIDTYKKANVKNGAESERILLHLQKNGRIIPEEFKVKKGWNPATIDSKNTMVVYTAITAQYDDLKEPPLNVFNNARWVAFTDCKSSSQIWHMEQIHSGYADPCRNAKIHKVLPHVYFPDATYSLWIDGSVQPKPSFDLNEMIENYLGGHDLAVFKHHARDCAYSEAETCIRLKKDDIDIIERQMLRYEYEGYPRKNGLAECTVLLRRHTESIRSFNETWWQEIQNHSRRDQLSFNYVAWKLRLKYCCMNGSIKNNAFFVKVPHGNK